ncbi:hypothetical protein [Limobrevibacterium gyesilva]|uniref:Uncharacterized protein n=1 Tax=Limobrevibacterium gyesilva TaxID=2991712 RepID=A0AA42CK08_9PROT|nr:hypothetical protein [Limobrevibacterium gyesilva]MCW3477380.1 hypothetical protein [Limobrevibacterium gyesilva]
MRFASRLCAPAILACVVIFGPAVALVSPALAQLAPAGVASPTTGPFGPLVDAVLQLVQPVLLAVAAILARALLQRFKIDQHEAAVTLITGAAQRGAGIAYGFIAAAGATIADAQIHNVAVAKGVSYVTAAFPDTLRALGVTPDRIEAMVQAELGRLLGVDPAVTIAPMPMLSPATAGLAAAEAPAAAAAA